MAALMMLLPLAAASCSSCPTPPPAAAPSQGQHDAGEHTAQHHGQQGHHRQHGQHHGAHHGQQDQYGSHHAHGPLVHRFDSDAEEWAKRFEGPKRDKYQKPAEVVAAMAIRPGARVADVGTGTGYFLPYLSTAVGPEGQVIAADIEPTMIRYVKARAAREQLANISPRLVLVDDPLLPDAALDRIMIVNTWHHIPDRIRYAQKLRQALVPGGSVWILDFKMSAPKGPHPKHRILPSKVAEELTAAGFKVRIDDTLLPNQYMAIGERS